MTTVNVAEIHAAADRIAGVAIRTPLYEHPDLNARVGRRVLLKLENLQLVGAFKMRGAYNHLSARRDEIGPGGVLAWSSGNHAQAVARSAKLLGMKATIVMPADAPKIKVAGVERDGAEIVLYDRNTGAREELGRRIAEETGAVIVPPYDHPLTIAGQGTAGLEIAEDCMSREVTPVAAVAPCGGGGLCSGMGLALKDVWPDIAIIAAEPEGYDETARSLASGAREKADTSRPSICDALMAPAPGELTLPILQSLGASGVAVSEDAVREAVAFAARRLKLVIEPGGAAGLAALMSGAASLPEGPVAVVVSGGNIDPAMLADILAAVPDR